MKTADKLSELTDPAAAFSHPSALVAAADIAPAQKLGLLEQWALDLEQRQASVDEGMTPEAPGAAEADAAILRFVQNAIRSISSETGRQAD